MNNHIFIIENKIYIRLQSIHVPIQQISCMNEMHIFWHKNNSEILIGVAWSSEVIDNLVEVLSNALKNALIFNYKNYTSPAICNNEYLLPEELHDSITLHAQKLDRETFIDTLPFLICTTRNRINPKLATWIYNDENSNIILEIGEQFIWPELPETEDELLTSTNPIIQDFFQFIENYKPMIKTIIPRDIATTWLKQATELQSLMNMNEKLDCPECMNNSHSSGQVHMRETK